MNENMLPIGTVLRSETYQIEKQIGSGGFGNTYVVRNISFDEVFAMKEFFMKDFNLRDGLKVTVSIPGHKATFESQRNKFKKEAQRLWKFDNPHIVKVRDLFEENGTVYYVMNYIDGLTLSDIVIKEGPMDETKALDIFRQMLDALSVVHNQDPMMLHLDIKPANIMVDKSGNAYLLDFGSSKQVDTDNNMTSSAFTMTPGYAPSELIDGNKSRIGPWTDLYELGATLYHILTGQQPPTISEMTEDGEKAFAFPPTISDKIRELILWLMSLSREKRPKSVEEVLKRIGQIEQKLEPGPAPEPEPAPDAGTIGEETILSSSEAQDSGDKTVYNNPDPEPLTSDSDSNNNNLLYAILGIIVVGGLLFYLFGRDGSRTTSTDIVDTDTLEEVVEEIVEDSIIEVIEEPEDVKEYKASNKATHDTKVERSKKEEKEVVKAKEVVAAPEPPKEEESKVHDVVEEMPQFPGGPSALFEYLSKNIKYPVVAEENGVQGRVIVTFIVERDGSISNVKVTNPVDPSLDREALRVVISMPHWIPGKSNGKAVRVKYTVPVTFRLT